MTSVKMDIPLYVHEYTIVGELYQRESKKMTSKNQPNWQDHWRRRDGGGVVALKRMQKIKMRKKGK